MTTPEQQEAEEFVVDITDETQEATNVFFSMMQQRHLMGQEKYGPVKFVEANTLIEAMEEVVDLANYAMYSFIKLWMLNNDLKKMMGDPANKPDMIGPESFLKGH